MRAARTSLVAALRLVLAGCGFVGAPGEETEKRSVSKINLQQATDKADLIMQGTLRAVQPELTWVHGPSLDRSCGDYKVDGRATGSMSRNVVVMTVVSKARRGSLLGLIERYWKSQGYTITSVNPKQRNARDLCEDPRRFSHEEHRWGRKVSSSSVLQRRVSLLRRLIHPKSWGTERPMTGMSSLIPTFIRISGPVPAHRLHAPFLPGLPGREDREARSRRPGRVRPVVQDRRQTYGATSRKIVAMTVLGVRAQEGTLLSVIEHHWKG